MRSIRVPRDRHAVLRGTDHWRCVDPELDWYDPVAVERTLAGEDSGCQLSHAEKVAAVRLELGRGGSANSVCGLLGIDDRTAKKLIAESTTGDCMYKRRACEADNCDVMLRIATQRLRYCSHACRNRAARHRARTAVSTTTAA